MSFDVEIYRPTYFKDQGYIHMAYGQLDLGAE